MPYVLQNPNLHYHAHNSLTFVVYSPPAKTSPHSSILVFKDPFQCYPPIFAYRSFWVSHRKSVYIYHLYRIRHVQHPSCFLRLITIIPGVERKSWSSSLCNFHQPPVSSFLLGPNIIFSTVISKHSCLFASFNVRNQASHPHKISWKITVLYIFIFTFIDTRWEYSELNDKYSPKLIYCFFLWRKFYFQNTLVPLSSKLYGETGSPDQRGIRTTEVEIPW